MDPQTKVSAENEGNGNEQSVNETNSSSNERVEPVNDVITDTFEVVENAENNQQLQNVASQEESHHNEKSETIGAVINDVEQHSGNQTIPPSTSQPPDEEFNNIVISGIRIIEDYHSSGENLYDPHSVTPPPQTDNFVPQMNNHNDTQQNSASLSSGTASATVAGTCNTVLSGRQIDESFEDYLKAFLEKDVNDLDSHEIRSFTAKTPRNYRPLPSQFALIFEVLCKIKGIEKRDVYNDALSLIYKIFGGIEFNKFLVEYWNELKTRGINPIGYSFSEGQSKFNYRGVNSELNDPSLLNEKTHELAWSLLIDLDASMKYILQILRRLSCLGEFMIDIDGKDTPIFLYYIRNVISDPIIQADKHRYDLALSLMVSVAWAPRRGLYCFSLIRPNFVLNEIMTNLAKKDQFFSSWIKALNDFFHPLEKFSCSVEWKEGVDSFDNPGTFLLAIVQYFKRGNSDAIDKVLRDILQAFKKSMSYCRVPILITNFDAINDLDWLSAYLIVSELKMPNFKPAIPASLFKALPPNCRENYTCLANFEETLDQALVSIFELFFTVGFNIPADFYKHIWQTYPSPSSIIDTVARCVITAIKNLKNDQKIVIDRNFKNLVMEICFCMDKTFLDSMSSFLDMDSQFVFECYHIFIISRVLRFLIEGELGRQKRVVFKDLNSFIQDLFHILFKEVVNKFTEFRDSHLNSWPPWRRDRDSIIGDKALMAICHSLDIIQKDAFCIFEMTENDDNDLNNYFFFLYRKRKVVGINYSKANDQISKLYPLQQENERTNTHRGGHSNFYDQNYQNSENYWNSNYVHQHDYSNDQFNSTNGGGNSSYGGRGGSYYGRH